MAWPLRSYLISMSRGYPTAGPDWISSSLQPGRGARLRYPPSRAERIADRRRSPGRARGQGQRARRSGIDVVIWGGGGGQLSRIGDTVAPCLAKGCLGPPVGAAAPYVTLPITATLRYWHLTI